MYSGRQLKRNMLVTGHKLMFLNTEKINLYDDMKLLSQTSVFLCKNIFLNHIFEIYKGTRSKPYHQQLCILAHVDEKQKKYGELSDDQLLYVYFSTFEFQQHLVLFFENIVLLLLCTQLFRLCAVKLWTHLTSMLVSQSLDLGTV